jgi:hypothetical protein
MSLLNENHIGKVVRIDYDRHSYGVGWVPGGSYLGEVATIQETSAVYGVVYRVFFKNVIEPQSVMISAITKVTVFEEKPDDV